MPREFGGHGGHDDGAPRRGLTLPEHIVCVDCGGRCHLGSYEPHEGWQPGDVAFYRCEDCLDRWDVEIPDDQPFDD